MPGRARGAARLLRRSTRPPDRSIPRAAAWPDAPWRSGRCQGRPAVPDHPPAPAAILGIVSRGSESVSHAQVPWQPGTTAGPRPAAPFTGRGYPASQPPAQMRPGTEVGESQLPDLALYERLIGDGVAAADARGSAVDHVTARRLAI